MAYKVKEITGNKPWASEKAGPMMDYYLTVVDSQGVETPRVTLSQKTSTAAPAVGQELEGNLDQTQYGLKFKKAFAQGGGGGGPRGKSPQESAAIQRMHLQKTAPQWIELFLTIGVIKAPKTKEDAVKLGEGIMDWLSKDVEKAKAKA